MNSDIGGYLNLIDILSILGDTQVGFRLLRELWTACAVHRPPANKSPSTSSTPRYIRGSRVWQDFTWQIPSANKPAGISAMLGSGFEVRYSTVLPPFWIQLEAFRVFVKKLIPPILHPESDPAVAQGACFLQSKI